MAGSNWPAPADKRILNRDHMDFSAGSLFVSLVVSAVGAGLLIYGKKQKRPPQLIVGVAMSVYPYFIDNVWIMLAIAAALGVGLWLALRFGH